MNDYDITPGELAEKLEKREDIILIDVREPYEWHAGHVDGAQHIPLAQVPQRVGEIPRDRDIVMICRSGGRSEHARGYLAENGFTRVKNLIGGMQRWARDVDSSITVA